MPLIYIFFITRMATVFLFTRRVAENNGFSFFTRRVTDGHGEVVRIVVCLEISVIFRSTPCEVMIGWSRGCFLFHKDGHGKSQSFFCNHRRIVFTRLVPSRSKIYLSLSIRVTRGKIRVTKKSRFL